ncbi:uncharacterized protein RCC_09867 [Ramularia collo-cygni]|uniref:Uncharacterized protein n=1 Tax=Ramularia collo-cygni TaxID=112498 RepID=A0A2D3VB14_9PEZI|nr:uncharacterized protein RCC_09867 [Ramularia collo-cygni]CZT24150.1 uncharacterized protein RCC_09867 [Ramularia collo-cygni]
MKCSDRLRLIVEIVSVGLPSFIDEVLTSADRHCTSQEYAIVALDIAKGERIKAIADDPLACLKVKIRCQGSNANKANKKMEEADRKVAEAQYLAEQRQTSVKEKSLEGQADQDFAIICNPDFDHFSLPAAPNAPLGFYDAQAGAFARWNAKLRRQGKSTTSRGDTPGGRQNSDGGHLIQTGAQPSARTLPPPPGGWYGSQTSATAFRPAAEPRIGGPLASANFGVLSVGNSSFSDRSQRLQLLPPINSRDDLGNMAVEATAHRYVPNDSRGCSNESVLGDRPSFPVSPDRSRASRNDHQGTVGTHQLLISPTHSGRPAHFQQSTQEVPLIGKALPQATQHALSGSEGQTAAGASSQAEQSTTGLPVAQGYAELTTPIPAEQGRPKRKRELGESSNERNGGSTRQRTSTLRASPPTDVTDRG